MKITRYRTVEEEDHVPVTLNGFRGWEFTSGPTTGADFDVFARLFKACIKKSLPPGATLVNCSSGHYILSGFVQREDKFVYFSISDVRHFPEKWHKDILVRTAKCETDYTGGSNGYATLETFTDAVNRLLGGERLPPRLPI